MQLLNCDTCALFLKNQKRFDSTPYSQEAIQLFRNKVKNRELLLPHGSYLINLANAESVQKTYACFVDDVNRCHQLGIKLYNVHPGSDVHKIGKDALKLVAQQINRVHQDVPDVTILLENMAGQGNTLCRYFDDFAFIFDLVADKSRVGVTLDTAHLFGAGHDIRTPEKFEQVMKEFERIVGMRYLKAMHLNDSKCTLGSREDRHEEIGKGLIGIDAFKYIMRSSRFDNIPLILETPNPENFKNEIAMLRSFEADMSL